jgi:hypothetical protein
MRLPDLDVIDGLLVILDDYDVPGRRGKRAAPHGGDGSVLAGSYAPVDVTGLGR